MNFNYPATIIPDENNTFVVTFEDVPEAITIGSSKSDIIEYAKDALIASLRLYIDNKELLPIPSDPKPNQLVIKLPLMINLKLFVYQLMRKQKITQIKIAKLIGKDPRQIRRVLDLDRESKLSIIEDIFAVLRQDIYINIEENYPTLADEDLLDTRQSLALLKKLIQKLPAKRLFSSVEQKDIKVWFGILEGSIHPSEEDEMRSWKLLCFQGLWVCWTEVVEGKRTGSEFIRSQNDPKNFSQILVSYWDDIVSICRKNRINFSKVFDNCLGVNRELLCRCLENSVFNLSENQNLSLNLSYSYLAILESKLNWVLEGNFAAALYEKYGTMAKFPSIEENDKNFVVVWNSLKPLSETGSYPSITKRAIWEILCWYEMEISLEIDDFDNYEQLIEDVYKELTGRLLDLHNYNIQLALIELCRKWVSITDNLDATRIGNLASSENNIIKVKFQNQDEKKAL